MDDYRGLPIDLVPEVEVEVALKIKVDTLCIPHCSLCSAGAEAPLGRIDFIPKLNFAQFCGGVERSPIVGGRSSFPFSRPPGRQPQSIGALGDRGKSPRSPPPVRSFQCISGYCGTRIIPSGSSRISSFPPEICISRNIRTVEYSNCGIFGTCRSVCRRLEEEVSVFLSE